MERSTIFHMGDYTASFVKTNQKLDLLKDATHWNPTVDDLIKSSRVQICKEEYDRTVFGCFRRQCLFDQYTEISNLGSSRRKRS